MTCRRCIHFSVCSKDEQTRYYGKEIACNNVEELCQHFQDKSALEKQIPKKVKPKQRGNSTDFCCPRCGSRIRVMRGKFWIGGYKDKFCRYCGCELDWSDTE